MGRPGQPSIPRKLDGHSYIREDDTIRVEKVVDLVSKSGLPGLDGTATYMLHRYIYLLRPDAVNRLTILTYLTIAIYLLMQKFNSHQNKYL
jgi:hypothetical protein